MLYSFTRPGKPGARRLSYMVNDEERTFDYIRCADGITCVTDDAEGLAYYKRRQCVEETFKKSFQALAGAFS